MKTIVHYFYLVKFVHTIFALPFALIAYFYALSSTAIPFEWLLLVKILLAMIFARNTAMGFNRYIDRDIDFRNERTQNREIPSGKISARNALFFVIINAILFVLTALWINNLAFYLSPVALLLLVGYSYTKRFTAWCHIILGMTLGIAPVGAYIAATGTIALVPVLLTCLVITWAGGFDIIYSIQDIDFDREQGLRSVPARWGVKPSLVINALLHVLSAYTVYVIGLHMNGGLFYKIGAGLFIGLLLFQHLYITPKHIDRAGPSFSLLNGLASISYALFVILGFYL